MTDNLLCKIDQSSWLFSLKQLTEIGRIREIIDDLIGKYKILGERCRDKITLLASRSADDVN